MTWNLSLNSLVLLLLLNLEEESTVDMWQDTSEGDGGADKSVELLVTTNSQLQVTGGDTLDLEILGSVLAMKLAYATRHGGWADSLLPARELQQ